MVVRLAPGAARDHRTRPHQHLVPEVNVEPDPHTWAAGGRRNVRGPADVLGVAPEVYLAEPAHLVHALQDHVSRAIADLPIESTRMPAGAEPTLGLASGVLPPTQSPSEATTTR
ncbi:hypothetical protein ACGFZR_22630 [Streptomyces sp. NPDC048241]|uniref:hypothetical protein n=1 Tax=Streptomyces sp. NPDC048241 TaxID=3365521 RepID=UPI003719D1C5